MIDNAHIDVGVHFASRPEAFSVRLEYITYHSTTQSAVDEPYFRLSVGNNLTLYLSPAQASGLWHAIAEHPDVVAYDIARSEAIAAEPIRPEEYERNAHVAEPLRSIVNAISR